MGRARIFSYCLRFPLPLERELTLAALSFMA